MTASDTDLATLMTALDDPAFLARFSPRAIPARDHVSPGAELGLSLRRSGYARLDELTSVAEAEALVASIDALASESLPPIFVYSFDEVWRIGERVAGLLSEALAAPYALLPDVWAFRVEPGPENAGWNPHRGAYELVDRATPEILNVWIALTDASVENSCMFVVPLDDDTAYPNALSYHDASRTHGRPLPVPRGTGLVWNANVLHWGGSSTARASTARVSITFTLQRVASRSEAPPRLATASHEARLDVLAHQIAVYGDLERDFPAPLRRWAMLRLAMRNAAKGSEQTAGRKAP